MAICEALLLFIKYLLKDQRMISKWSVDTQATNTANVCANSMDSQIREIGLSVSATLTRKFNEVSMFHVFFFFKIKSISGSLFSHMRCFHGLILGFLRIVNVCQNAYHVFLYIFGKCLFRVFTVNIPNLEISIHTQTFPI